jgi:hypothetical protein
LAVCFFRQSLETLAPRRCTIGAQQQHVHQSLMNTVIVAILFEALYAFAVTVKPCCRVVQVVK